MRDGMAAMINDIDQAIQRASNSSKAKEDA
jgi:hypothetical protein